MTKANGDSKRQFCLDFADEADELVFADGYDEAILGLVACNGVEAVVYDATKVLRVLCRRDGMSLDEAEAFFEFNVVGAWVGERTPLFLRPFLHGKRA